MKICYLDLNLLYEYTFDLYMTLDYSGPGFHLILQVLVDFYQDF
jgi:hypothetical protein